MITDFNISLGSRQFLNVKQMKGHVLQRARACAHLKVPGWSLVWKALLTKKLPMFLSRLNEINGGCEKTLPVSGACPRIMSTLPVPSQSYPPALSSPLSSWVERARAQ